ncbi:hypothetical protein PMAYCL1PPCAC_25927, partial [Pristionchus mayeri]
RLDEVNRSGVAELEAEVRRLNDRLDHAIHRAEMQKYIKLQLEQKMNQRISEWGVTKKLREQIEALRADVNEWLLWYENNRIYFGSNVRQPPTTLNCKPSKVHIPPPSLVDPTHDINYQSMVDSTHEDHLGDGAPPSSFLPQAIPNQPSLPGQFNSKWRRFE